MTYRQAVALGFLRALGSRLPTMPLDRFTVAQCAYLRLCNQAGDRSRQQEAP